MTKTFEWARSRQIQIAILWALGTSSLFVSACQTTPLPDPPSLIEVGEQLFLNETFSGNGRTCGSCHRPTDEHDATLNGKN